MFSHGFGSFSTPKVSPFSTRASLTLGRSEEADSLRFVDAPNLVKSACNKYRSTINTQRFRGSMSMSVNIGQSQSDDVRILEVLLEFISTHVNALKACDEDTWQEFNNMSGDLCGGARAAVPSVVNALLHQHGFSLEDGWDYQFVDVDALLTDFGNLYLSEQAKFSIRPDELEMTEEQVQAEAGVKDIAALTFCPNTLFSNRKAFDSKPCSQSYDSVVFMADISGFSKFAGESCQRGAKGLDVLHRVTNDFLGHMVHTVYDYDGDVIAFAGDALVCIFPSSKGEDGTNARTLEESCAQALLCASALKRHKLQSSSGHSLSGHFGVSCGPVSLGLLGGHQDDWVYLMNGPCVSELTSCIEDAQPQEVVCTKAVYEKAASITAVNCDEKGGSGNMLVNDVVIPIRSNSLQRNSVTALQASGKASSNNSLTNNSMRSVRDAAAADDGMSVRAALRAGLSRQSTTDSLHFGHSSRTSDGSPLKPQSADKLLNNLVKEAKLYIPKPVLNAMSTGSLEGIAELRKVTTMFLNLDSYDNKLHADPMSLQQFFRLLQEVLHESGGFLRQFLIDDKGCVAIAMWGVPGFAHTNDCSRGLYFAYHMHEKVKKVKHACSIGLTTGNVYCGIIGSNIRRDYACIGDKVNIAARLMAKAKGRVLVDPDVHSAIDNDERANLELAQTLQLKGMSEPVTPFTFAANVDIALLSNKAAEKKHSQNTVIRKEVRDTLMSILNSMRKDGSQLSMHRPVDMSQQNVALSPSGPSTPRGGDSSPSPSSALSKVPPMLGSAAPLTSAILIGDTILSPRTMQKQSSQIPSSTTLTTQMKSFRRELSRKGSLSKEEGVKMVIVIGISGTGKSTSAGLFRSMAEARALRTRVVHCKLEDDSNPFSVAKKIFWALVDRAGMEDDFQARYDFVKGMLRADDQDSNDGSECSSDDGDRGPLHNGVGKNLSQRMESMGGISELGSIGPPPGRADTFLEQLLIGVGKRARGGSITSFDGMTDGRQIDSVDSNSTSFKESLAQPSSLSSFTSQTHTNMMSSSRSGMRKSYHNSIGLVRFPSVEEVEEYDENDDENDENGNESAQPSPGRAKASSVSEASSYVNLHKLMNTMYPTDYDDVKNRLYDMIVDLIRDKPTALTIEDAHFCDERTWMLLHALQARLKDNFAIMICIQIPAPSHANFNPLNPNRSVAFGSAAEELKYSVKASGFLQNGIDDSNSTSRGAQNYLSSAAYANIITHKLTRVIEMKELNEAEVKEVLKRVLDMNALPEALVKKVTAITQGNAFWVKTIAHFIKRNGVDGFVKTVNTKNAMDPLKNLVICRLEKLTPEQLLVLKHASVIGEEFTYQTLAAVLPEAVESHLPPLLGMLIEDGFIYNLEEHPISIFGFHNQLTRETIYEMIPPGDTSQIHLTAAKFIESAFKSDLKPFYQTLCYHYSLAMGHRTLAFKYGLKAADNAIGKGAYRNGLAILFNTQKLTNQSPSDLQKLLAVVNKALTEIRRQVNRAAKDTYNQDRRDSGDQVYSVGHDNSFIQSSGHGSNANMCHELAASSSSHLEASTSSNRGQPHVELSQLSQRSSSKVSEDDYSNAHILKRFEDVKVRLEEKLMGKRNMKMTALAEHDEYDSTSPQPHPQSDPRNGAVAAQGTNGKGKELEVVSDVGSEVVGSTSVEVSPLNSPKGEDGRSGARKRPTRVSSLKSGAKGVPKKRFSLIIEPITLLGLPGASRQQDDWNISLNSEDDEVADGGGSYANSHPDGDVSAFSRTTLPKKAATCCVIT